MCNRLHVRWTSRGTGGNKGDGWNNTRTKNLCCGCRTAYSARVEFLKLVHFLAVWDEKVEQDISLFTLDNLACGMSSFISVVADN